MEQDAKVTDDNIMSLYCILQRCSIQEIYSSNRKTQNKKRRIYTAFWFRTKQTHWITPIWRLSKT